MPTRYQPSDLRFLKDLWKASKPSNNEHRLVFTFNFTPKESERLRGSANKLNTEALRTVRDLLADHQPSGIVVIVEQNDRDTEYQGAIINGLHAHGWLIIDKSISAKKLMADLNYKISSTTVRKGRRQEKIESSNGICIKETYLNKNHFPASRTLPDIGWVYYISKHFSKPKKNTIQPTRWFSASNHLRSSARLQGKQRELRFKKFKEAFLRST